MNTRVQKQDFIILYLERKKWSPNTKVDSWFWGRIFDLGKSSVSIYPNLVKWYCPTAKVVKCTENARNIKKLSIRTRIPPMSYTHNNWQLVLNEGPSSLDMFWRLCWFQEDDPGRTSTLGSRSFCKSIFVILSNPRIWNLPVSSQMEIHKTGCFFQRVHACPSFDSRNSTSKVWGSLAQKSQQLFGMPDQNSFCQGKCGQEEVVGWWLSHGGGTSRHPCKIKKNLWREKLQQVLRK